VNAGAPHVGPVVLLLLRLKLIAFLIFQRGNVIRYNHIHDTKRLQPGADVRGIMLDDQYSSALIEHNVFHDVRLLL